MRYLKMLGLAALAAMALTAVIGAGTASAVTKVCSTSGTGTSCGEGHGNEYTGAIDATLEAGTSALLTSSFDNVTCKVSTIQGTITTNTPPAGHISSMTFSECTDSFGSKCTAATSAKTTNLWPSSAVATSGTNGTMIVENVTGEFTCPVFGVNTTCRYKTAKAEASITGGEPATVRAEKVKLTKEEVSGGACSSEATWSGSYLVTTPATLNITP